MATLENHLVLVQSESEHLKRYLHTLPAVAWRRPSACAGWDVRDVVGHLIVNAEFLGGSVSQGLQGHTSPLLGLPDAGSVNAAMISERLDRMSIARRESLGERLLATFDATNDQINQLFVGLKPADWDTPCYHLAGIFSARAFLNLRITEVAMHEWDIRAGLETAAHLSTESLPLFMAGVRGVIRWAFRRGPTLPEPVRYRFVLTGAVPGTHDLVVTGDTARLEPAGTAEAQATIQGDTEAFILLAYGRLTLDEALRTGRCDGQCEHELIAAFDRWFQGV